MYWIGSPRNRCSIRAAKRPASATIGSSSECAISHALSLSSTNSSSVSASRRACFGCGPKCRRIAPCKIKLPIELTPPGFHQPSTAPPGSAQSAHPQSAAAAPDHQVQLVQRQPDAVIRHPVLRKVIGANLLAAVARAHLLLAFLGQLRILPLHFLLIKPRPQHAHALLAILDLRLLVLAADYSIRRQVRN